MLPVYIHKYRIYMCRGGSSTESFPRKTKKYGDLFVILKFRGKFLYFSDVL